MNEKYIQILAEEFDLNKGQVSKSLKLFEEGATIPFIARYRKELTGGLDELTLLNIQERMEKIRELDKRRESITASLIKNNFLTPELEQQLAKAQTLSELEDIYLPFKPKRKTRAGMARAKGLEPLAKILMRQTWNDIIIEAEKFINKKNEINSAEDALSGARDIIAEWVSENKIVRNRIRRLFYYEATIKSSVVKSKKEEAGKFENYFDFEETLKHSPSHRILAMYRGENEGLLRLKIAPPLEKAIELIESVYIKNNSDAAQQVRLSVKDSYKRLLHPSIETEFRNETKERADKEAIRVFTDNLRQLLMAPPLGGKSVLAIDPGFRSGCKLVCLNKQGKLLHNETIYPHPPQREMKQAIHKIQSLVKAYKIETIAIGNGTAGRETERFIGRIRFDGNIKIIALMVNENGASVYSASPAAREEFPQYDITVRGAVSIGRRLMDPLAELVKIDPKSIGVGQYQHDVNQAMLAKGLEDTVMSCVNAVGVEVNTASKQLLSYVSGIGPSLAQNIITYRNENGNFRSRNNLKKVARFGAKAFEQAAGFLRIGDGENPLDKSAVHPESYGIVERMAKSLKVEIDELLKNPSLREKINIKDFTTEKAGIPTLKDIMDELAKPGRDPRQKFEFFQFNENINSINDLTQGMILPGIITNITAFGAFVDVGVHQDGLVHKSKISEEFVSDPSQFLKLNQKVNVEVVNIDMERNRIQFSMVGIEQPKNKIFQ